MASCCRGEVPKLESPPKSPLLKWKKLLKSWLVQRSEVVHVEAWKSLVEPLVSGGNSTTWRIPNLYELGRCTSGPTTKDSTCMIQPEKKRLVDFLFTILRPVSASPRYSLSKRTSECLLTFDSVARRFCYFLVVRMAARSNKNMMQIAIDC